MPCVGCENGLAITEDGLTIDIDAAMQLLERSRRFAEFDAQMMADLTRFSPLPPEAQWAHDNTESESEKWLREYEEFKKKTLLTKPRKQVD